MLGFRALLLAVSALLLTVSPLAKRLKLIRHLLDSPSQVSRLASDAREAVLAAACEEPPTRLSCRAAAGGSATMRL